MTNLEKLEEEADQEGIPIDNIRFESERIKGLYCDGNIALSADLQTSADRSAILAEELGHHYTSSGNILDQSDTGNRKQELRAHVWAYNRLIGLQGLIAGITWSAPCMPSWSRTATSCSAEAGPLTIS